MTSYTRRTLTAAGLGWGTDRTAVRSEVFELLRACQTDGAELGALDVASLIEHAEQHGWPDVAKLLMFLGILHDRYVSGGRGEAWAASLLRRARADGDDVMTALALALRAQDTGGERPAIEADRELARASVLLEERLETSSELVCAHIECAQAYERRELWEREQLHHASAQACLDPEEGIESHPAVLAFNRAETEVNWVAALRERGASPELEDRVTRARRALGEAIALDAMPGAWREELLIFSTLVDAISPPPGVQTSPAGRATGVYAGYVHLALALRTPDIARARMHCERAIAAMDSDVTARVRLFAGAIAAELEAAEAGHETAGLRWGREQIALRWSQRLGALASMESLIAVERRAAEHALLQQHAFVDVLTGTANRRGLQRFLARLDTDGGATAAVAMLDLDRFKSINDVHGHTAGDQALLRVATILRTSVRDDDLVVRLGGDEFLLLLPATGIDAAAERCQEIVDAVGAWSWSAICEGLEVSVSAGLAHGAVSAFPELCAAADAALYRVKQAGGARVGRADRSPARPGHAPRASAPR